MWDWYGWQEPQDYGTRYDYGLVELAASIMSTFYKNNKAQPETGWLGSILNENDWRRCRHPDKTLPVDQRRWAAIAMGMGGLGATGRLQFTRGTIAACWAIEQKPKQVILVGFDNIAIGRTLAIDDAFCRAYQKNPGTFSFNGYRTGQTKFGNHDYAIERPLLEHLALVNGVELSFAQDVW